MLSSKGPGKLEQAERAVRRQRHAPHAEQAMMGKKESGGPGVVQWGVLQPGLPGSGSGLLLVDKTARLGSFTFGNWGSGQENYGR